jgi:hypothetical protein
MNTTSVLKSLGRLALVAFAAMPACGGRTADLVDAGSSGGGSGGGGNGSGFPYSGPSCNSNTIPPSCWSCIENSCPSLGSCITSTCSAYFNCYCACNQGDSNCLQGCQSTLSPACDSCVASSEQCLVTGCTQACTSTIMMGASGSSSGGSGFGSSTGGGSSGGTSTSQCTGSGTCSNGQTLESCMTLENGFCTEAYYQVGDQVFSCASCTDTNVCVQEAKMACQ